MAYRPIYHHHQTLLNKFHHRNSIMVKPTSIDDIVPKFLTKILPPITGEPDYDCISQLNQLMYGNAATLPTTLGGGAYGHVSLIMKATLYVTLAATAYVTPNKPPLTPDIPSTATSASKQQLRDQHAEEHQIFTNNVNMDDAIKTQLLDAVEEPYVSKLRNRYTGYIGVTTQDLLDHLMDRYSNTVAADLKANEARINEALDNSRPIDVFFQHIDDVVQYANYGEKSFTANQVLQTAFHSINATSLYREACKEWRAIFPRSIMRYANNSAYWETPDSTVQILSTRQLI